MSGQYKAFYKAFQGPNGWYVAWQREDGFHRQPQFGAHMREEDAKRLARSKNAEHETEER